MKIMFETQVHRVETADGGRVHCLLKGMSFDSGQTQLIEAKLDSPNAVAVPRFGGSPAVVMLEFDEQSEARADDKAGLMSMYRAMVLGLEAMRAIRKLTPKCEAELADIRAHVWDQLTPREQAILEREAE
jgi:hypothetical protein